MILGLLMISSVISNGIIPNEMETSIIKIQSGGNGGLGGNAVTNPVINCNVAGACPQYNIGGNGGAGGSVIDNGSSPLVNKQDKYNPPASSQENHFTRTRFSKISRCVLEIGGNKLIDSAGCTFEQPVDPNTTSKKYSLRSNSDPLNYVATWTVSSGENATGYLTGGSTSAERSLGVLYLNGSCWINNDNSVRICAWK